jgi:hypothetical protein
VEQLALVVAVLNPAPLACPSGAVCDSISDLRIVIGMRTDGKAELQHYVPQVLLRLHVNDASAKRGKEQVWCFDKKTGKVFPVNIRGVMSGTRFYEVEVDGETLSLEEPLSEIEGQLSPILARLVRDQNLNALSNPDRGTIAAFCAVQLVRTQGFRDRIKEVNEGVAEALRRREIDPAQVSNFEMLSEQQIKEFSLEMLADAPPKYGPYFLSKYWHLVAATADDPFHLGDHPVVLDNDVWEDQRGALGLASPGVTIYLPLAPTLCLAMTDSALVADLFAGARKVESQYKQDRRKLPRRHLSEQQDAYLQDRTQKRDRAREQVGSFKHGTPSGYDSRIVTRVNSLQMLYAGRWIVSSKPDFSLPLKMIAGDPALRRRRRLEVR